MKYVCDVCGWVYDEDETGVKWEDLPEDFECELCGVGKDQFTAEESSRGGAISSPCFFLRAQRLYGDDSLCCRVGTSLCPTI